MQERAREGCRANYRQYTRHPYDLKERKETVNGTLEKDLSERFKLLIQFYSGWEGAVLHL